MNRVIISATLILALLAFGCIHPPTLDQPFKRDRVLNFSYDEVWDTTIKTLALSGDIIQHTDKESGVISFKKFVNPDSLKAIAFYDGSGVRNIITQASADMNFVLHRMSPNETRMIVNSEIQAQGLNEFNMFSGWRSYTSNGVLEKNYLDKIEVELEKSKTPKWLK